MDIIVTGDGSHSIHVPAIGENYHSSYGAITESEHVFIRTGLRSFAGKENLSVFEIGFGTGLNALLTCIDASETGSRISYHAIEKFPLDKDIIARLNYPLQISSAGDLDALFLAIHQAPWHATTTIFNDFHLHKIHADLTVYVPDFNYDLIYFDAFAPAKQPELWTPVVFERLYQSLNPGGILTTYCVQGEVRRRLRSAGFIVEKLPGPPGKREILRARKL